jgi:hypothetical protein
MVICDIVCLINSGGIMGTPAETVTSANYLGFRLAEEERKSGDIEVPLQTLTVQLPEEPLLVNGSPYGFEVDEDRLGQAINTVRKTFWQPGRFEPHSLKISLGESLPERIAGGDQSGIPTGFDYRKKTLRVVVPSEVSKTSMPEKLLAAQVEGVLNRDVVTGIEQSRQEKLIVGHRLAIYTGSLITGVAVGEGVGIATDPSSIGAVIERGIYGAGAGALLVTGAALTRVIYGNWRSSRKTGFDDALDSRAHLKVEKNGVGEDLQTLFEEPVVKLIPFSATIEARP